MNESSTPSVDFSRSWSESKEQARPECARPQRYRGASFDHENKDRARGALNSLTQPQCQTLVLRLCPIAGGTVVALACVVVCQVYIPKSSYPLHLWVLCFVCACTGQLIEEAADPGANPGDHPAGNSPTSGSSDSDMRNPTVDDILDPETQLDPAATHVPLTRLSNTQYRFAVSDLLAPFDLEPFGDLGPETAVGGFRSNQPIPVSDVEFTRYVREAERIASRVETPFALVDCDPNQQGDVECARKFVDTFGSRAYRRPLQNEERDSLLSLYQLGRADGKPGDAARFVLQAILLSPHFLYRIELGASPQETFALNGYELAARLSFFLWDSLPDEILIAAAKSGTLSKPDELERQARRMLADERGKRAIDSFFTQWLGVDKLLEQQKDTSVYPSYDERLALDFLRETTLFANAIVREGAGGFSALFVSDFSVLGGGLFEHYGLAPPASDTWMRFALAGSERSGVLTQGAFLAMHAHSNQTSPVHRGKVIRENIFCETMPAPPPDVDDTPPDVEDGLSTRERFAAHRENAACAGCHQLMDPIGVGFEAFDGVGRFREQEGGMAVDTTGTVFGTDVTGDFDGTPELSEKIASSQQALVCMVQNWFQYALEKDAMQGDIGSLQELHRIFEGEGEVFEELIVAIVRSEAFRAQAPAEEK